MEKDQYQVLLDRVKTVQESVDRIDTDLTHDRSDISDFKIRLGTVETQLKEVLDRMTRIDRRTKETVMSSVDTATKPLHKILESFVNNKKKVVVREVRIGLFDNLMQKFRKIGGEATSETKHKTS